MSYAVIRVQKIKSEGVRGIQSHDLREREPKTNPDIDHERSKDNYKLHEATEGFTRAVKARLEAGRESDKAVRKDAVVMASFIVTSDRAFFDRIQPDEEKAYFEQALRFLAGRYGKENVIAATVHKDERTPHMHVNLTPVRDGRLCYNEIFNRQELRDLQTAFAAEVGAQFGLLRGESREEKRRHMDTEEFKAKTRQAELQTRLTEQAKLAEKLGAQAMQIDGRADELEARKAELDARAAELEKIARSGPLIRGADVEPKKKSLLSRESSDEVADRLNRDFISPLVVARERAVVDLVATQDALKKAAARASEATREYDKLTAGLTAHQMEHFRMAVEMAREKNRKEREARQAEKAKARPADRDRSR